MFHLLHPKLFQAVVPAQPYSRGLIAVVPTEL
jgi:hypothetical protein